MDCKLQREAARLRASRSPLCHVPECSCQINTIFQKG